jgi:pSer/pThr/pTyr-binding forkhead associated (FHA) protein
MQARLIIESDQDQTHQEMIFDKPKISVGRKAGNDLHFNRAEISGHHAVFLYENSGYFVSDLGSTNGTQLNGSPIVAKEKYPLKHEDIVTISPYRIIFLEDRDMSATMMEAAPPEIENLRKSGSGTMLPQAVKVSTGTEEHGKRDFASLIQEDAAAKPEAEKQATAPQPASGPQPAVVPTPEPPQSPAKEAPAPKSAPAGEPVEPASAEPAASPGKLGDYAWLAIGGVFVLIAIGLILLVIAML